LVNGFLTLPGRDAKPVRRPKTTVVNIGSGRLLNLCGITPNAYVSGMTSRKIIDGGTTFEDDDLEEDEALASSGSDYHPPEVMLDLADLPRRLATGMAVIRAFWETLPGSPGVYRMISATDEVLYVGKARNLKARVSSYARGDAPNNRISRMIAETAQMEFVTTTTEAEALLLETNLIKQLKPRYNVLMRDDKSFPFILITGDHQAPQITKHRGARNRKGRYFGPFASAGAVNRTLNTLQRAFLLRSCADSVYENRSRPCLLFQIKRCAAPCTGEISREGYAALVREASDFLDGKSQAIRQHLAFFFRTFQNWGNRAFFPRADRAMEPAEVLGAFLAQFYDERPAPRLVLLSEMIEDRALLAEALSARAGHRVEIATPRRGEKRDLVEHALTNAKEALSRRLNESASQEKLLASLAQAFDLASPPRRIDVFDNSHISGTNAVGAMIVSGPRGFSKTHYRTYNIQSTEMTPGDDFGMMREVMQRRFARLLKESPRNEKPDDPEALPAWPDLVLIDGGKGQLEAVRGVLAELGITDLPLVGVAKGPDRDAGREQFVMPGREPFRLPPRDPTRYFIQRLRDEAHRFAIGTHRARRKKALTANPLDEISGIGPRRKRALLLHFGTAKAVSRASYDDLARVPGINEATARLVYDHFHEGGR